MDKFSESLHIEYADKGIIIQVILYWIDNVIPTLFSRLFIPDS